MKRFWVIFDIISLGTLIGFGMALSAGIIYSAFHGWAITFTFNEYREGIVEALLVPFVTIMASITAVRYVRNTPRGTQ